MLDQMLTHFLPSDANTLASIEGAQELAALTDETWQCDTLERAAFISERYQFHAGQIDAVKLTLQARVDALTLWANSEVERLTNQLTGLQGHLEYFARLRHTAGAGKTCALPGCTVRLRKAEPKVAERDDAQLLAFIKANGLETCIKESPAWAEFKKLCAVTEDGVIYKGTGEMVPGIRVEPPQSDLTCSITVSGA